MKLSKIGFSMECSRADFLRFFTKTRQNLVIGWNAGYSPSNPSISETGPNTLPQIIDVLLRFR